MKKIEIIGPTLVNGEMRFIHENPLTVTETEADRLHAAGLLVGDPAGIPGPKPVRAKSARKPRTRAKPAAAAAPPVVPAPVNQPEEDAAHD